MAPRIEPWLRLPGAAAAGVRIGVKGHALASGWADAMGSNINYCLDQRVPQVIMSGCHVTSDIGTFAGMTGFYSEVAGSFTMGPRGRSVVFQPFSGIIGYAFRAAHDGTGGEIEIYVGDSPWPNASPTGRYCKKTITVDSGSADLYAYTGQIQADEDGKYPEVPISVDGMVYVYFRLSSIAKLAAYSVWALPSTGL